MRRVFLKSVGATDEDLEKPLVAIANTWNEILPGSYHLDRIGAAVKRGIREAGGMATIFNVLAPCDGQGSGNEGFKYVLPSRDLIAASVEMMIEHASYDAAVMIGTCDTRSQFTAAARCTLPQCLWWTHAARSPERQASPVPRGEGFRDAETGQNQQRRINRDRRSSLSRPRRLLSHGHGEQYVHCR